MATRHDWYKAAALALRDRIVHRWLTAEKMSYDAGRKRVYYLSLEFLIGRLFTDALNNMGLLSAVRRGARRSRRRPVGLAQMRAGCRARQWRPRAARRMLHGKHGDARRFPRSATASATISACSARSSNNGWQQEYPDEWLSFGNPWEFQRPEVVYHVHFGGGVEHVECQGTRPRNLASGGNRAGGRLRHPDRRLARPARQRAPAVVGALARSAPARRLQLRRLCRRRRRGERARNRSANFSIRTTKARPAANSDCARNISSFRRRLQDLVKRHLGRGRANTRSRGESRGATQRYPSEPCRHRADADSRRPAQHPLGRCVEDHGRYAVLHQPHAVAGSARDLAGRVVRAAVAAASGNHLSHQCRSSCPRRGALSRRRRFPGVGLADRREIRPTRADGATGFRRLPSHQRRLGDAFRSDEGDRVPRSQPPLSRPHHQQDQRHHLPPLADARQSEADRSVARGLRRSRARRSDPAAAA